MTQNTEDNKTDSTAKTMVVIAWVAALVFATYLFQQVLDNRYNPNQELALISGEAGVREVILQRNRQGQYVANGRINGQRVTFLLDTGATDVAIPEPLARRLGLSRGAGGFSQTANGTVAVWSTRLDSVQLGAVGLKDVQASIVPSLKMGSTVLLGMSFLKKLEMVQRGGQLTLRQGVVSG